MKTRFKNECDLFPHRIFVPLISLTRMKGHVDQGMQTNVCMLKTDVVWRFFVYGPKVQILPVSQENSRTVKTVTNPVCSVLFFARQDSYCALVNTC